MVVEGSRARGQRPGVRGQAAACAVALVAVLPLLAPEVWSGFRLALADPVLSALTSFEQPLSVRSPGGVWAIGLAVAWFSLAYWHSEFAVWEAALVVVGGALALPRMGNMWLYAAALVLPIAAQVVRLKLNTAAASGVVAVCLVAAGYTLLQTRPPDLPGAAIQAVRQTTVQGNVLAHWRWAAELQRQLGHDRQVLASSGPAAQPTDFWLDYLRIAQGHEHWADLLRRLEVSTVVLDSGEQERRAAELVRSSDDWRVTYDSGNALVAERANP